MLLKCLEELWSSFGIKLRRLQKDYLKRLLSEPVHRHPFHVTIFPCILFLIRAILECLTFVEFASHKFGTKNQKPNDSVTERYVICGYKVTNK